MEGQDTLSRRPTHDSSLHYNDLSPPSSNASFTLLETDGSTNLISSSMPARPGQQRRQRPHTVGSFTIGRRRALPSVESEEDDEAGDLFPMNSRVYTNPTNIVPPAAHESIVMSDQQHPVELSVYRSTPGGSSHSVKSNPRSVAGDNRDTFGSQEQKPSSHQGHSGQIPLNAGIDQPSMLEEVDRESLTDSRPSTAFSVRLKHSTASLWARLTVTWDSFFLLLTLLLALIGLALAIVLSVVLHSMSNIIVHVKCVMTYKPHDYAEASITMLLSFWIPTFTYVVLFIVSIWIGVLCSRSRKRVLQSSPACANVPDLTSAFMLPCYEPIWYTISALSLLGIIGHAVSFTFERTEEHADEFASLTLDNSQDNPCDTLQLPLIWILQLLPMLMVQRSVSRQAVLRSIAYSGCVVIVMLVCFLTLYHSGDKALDFVSFGVHVLLVLFYCWAKWFFHARSTFDFFFVAAIISSLSSITLQIVTFVQDNETGGSAILRSCVHGIYALIVVALLVSMRADTRYWLGFDETPLHRLDQMRRYMRHLAERGMITNFSTRTSVYDVHRMIEDHRHNVVDISRLNLQCTVAQGATSIVLKGKMRSDTDIALKIYTSVQVTDEEVERFSHETALNVQLSHPNVVKFYGLCVVPPSISLVFEFCEYGGLESVLLTQKNNWHLSTKLKMWLDACHAVAYLHSFNPPLLHRDIKTDNFLVGHEFLVKLADFGEANLLKPRTDGTMTIVGTVDFMAPEMILGGKTARYGTAADVYSLMITLWQILVPDRSPWEHKSHLEVYTSVTKGERPPILPTISAGCAEILEMGWCANPSKRVAVEDIIPKVHQLWLLSLHQKPLRRTDGK